MPKSELMLSRVAPDGMTEEVYFSPSYTCGVHNCCEGMLRDDKSWHGIGSSMYRYVLKKEGRGISFTYHTGQYDQPELVREPMGSDISWHRPPVEADRSEDAYAVVTEGCDVTGGECACDGSGLLADELLKGVGTPVEHGAVFHAMRPFFREWLTIAA